jgi:putative transcriptional regulator
MTKMTDYAKTGKRLRPMSAEEVERAAKSDPDAQPLTEADLKRMKRVPQVRVIRRALELTQKEFSSRYRIPIGALRDWEQGRAEPDQPTLAFLTLIAHDAERMKRTSKQR